MMGYEFIFSKDVMEKIDLHGLKIELVKNKLQNFCDSDKDLAILKKVDFSQGFADEVTWKNYVLIGSVEKKDEEYVIKVDEVGILSKRSSDKKTKIYALDQNEGGITLRQHFENLKNKTNE